MQRITSDVADDISKRVDNVMYCTNPFWLVTNCLWEEKNGELLIWFDCPVFNCIHLLLPPKQAQNISGRYIELVKEDELEVLKKTNIKMSNTSLNGNEYYYRTQKMIDMYGNEMESFRRAVNFFRNNYKYKLLDEYDPLKIKEFIKNWADSKDLSSYTDAMKKAFWREAESCAQYIDLIGKLQSKNIFVEVNGKLAGFAMTTSPFPNMFVALQQKVDSKYKGLSRFLYHEKCKLNRDKEFFTTGFDDSPGLKVFKDSLHPDYTIPFYFITLGSV